MAPMNRHGVKAQHRCKASSTLALPSLPRRSAIYYLAAIVHQTSGLLIVRPPLMEHEVFHGCSHNPLDSPLSLLIGLDPIFAQISRLPPERSIKLIHGSRSYAKVPPVPTSWWQYYKYRWDHVLRPVNSFIQTVSPSDRSVTVFRIPLASNELRQSRWMNHCFLSREIN